MQKRPCWIEIATQAVEDNYRFLSSLAAPEMEVLAMIKANGYGHGLELCAAPLLRAGARWLGITSVDEGLELRAIAPDVRILAASGLFRGQAEAAIAAGITVAVWEPWQREELEAAAHKAGLGAGAVAVHLEIDSGMSRQGVSPARLATEEGRALLRHFGGSSPLKLEGVMSHLWGADEADGAANASQFAALERALELISGAGLFADWLNVGASAALVSGAGEQVRALAAKFGMRAMVRPGLAVFGVVPGFAPEFAKGSEPHLLLASLKALKPALSWKTKVVAVRDVAPGATVGYNGTFVATEPMRLALVAAGYADGVDRHLGNRFSMLVRGERAPIAGRVSMDQSVIDVTGIDGVAEGDEVVILGKQGEDCISVFEHAQATDTIVWEVFTRIGARVERRAK